MEKRPVKCAVIGLGRIASLLEDDKLREKPASHAGAIATNNDTVLEAGCDSDEERCRLFSERWNIDSVYTNAKEMLLRHRPDILHIATHSDSHAEYMELAIKNNISVVVCEKPVSNNLRAARRIEGLLKVQHRRAAARKKTRILINHERRYALNYRTVREHVQKGTYGELISIHGKVYMGRNRPVKDVLLHDGTHMLDIIPFLAGEPIKKMKVTGSSFFHPPRTIFIHGSCGAAFVSCEVGNSRDHLVFELELSFSKGRIRVGNGIYEEWKSVESPYYENFNSLKPVEIPSIEKLVTKTGYFSGMMEDAVRLVRDAEAEAVSSLGDGIMSLEIIEKVRRFR